MSAQLIKIEKRTQNQHYDEIVFPSGINEIHLYGYNIIDSNKKRRYFIELHDAEGFAMVKFYPKCLRKNKRKFELRGKHEIGFSIMKQTIINILIECAIIMRDYLDKNPNCFVGYVGQTDKRDNRNRKIKTVSQRYSIYSLLTNTIFTYPKYKLSSSKIFQEVNLRLIRKVRSKQEGKITKEQMVNYRLFLDYFEMNKEYHFELMTQETRKKYI